MSNPEPVAFIDATRSAVPASTTQDEAHPGPSMFCALDGRYLTVATDDAVALMLAIAGGEKNEGDVAAWLAKRVQGASNG